MIRPLKGNPPISTRHGQEGFGYFGRHPNSRQNNYRIEGSVAYIETNGGDVIIDKDKLEEVLRYNLWRVSIRGDVTSSKSKNINKKPVITCYKLHRVVTGAGNDMEVDHINHNRLDNRRANLRVCTHAQNGRNLPLKKNNASGFAGVRWDRFRNKWSARIKVNFQEKHLGRYETIEEAISARLFAEQHYFGEFAPNASNN